MEKGNLPACAVTDVAKGLAGKWHPSTYGDKSGQTIYHKHTFDVRARLARTQERLKAENRDRTIETTYKTIDGDKAAGWRPDNGQLWRLALPP